MSKPEIQRFVIVSAFGISKQKFRIEGDTSINGFIWNMKRQHFDFKNNRHEYISIMREARSCFKMMLYRKASR